MSTSYDLPETAASAGLNQGFQEGVLQSVRFSTGTGQLTEALAAAQAGFKEIKKNKLNPHTNSRYADLNEIVSATQPALSAQGLVIFQAPIVRDRMAGTLSRLSHKSGEFIENELLLPTSMPGKPDKFDAHSIASAITYSKRYSYTGLIGAVAEDDDDGNAAVQNVKVPYKPKPEYNSFSQEAEQETYTGTPGPLLKLNTVPKAIIPPELSPETEQLDFPTKEEKTAYLNRLRYVMKNVLPKTGIENPDESMQLFVKRFTGLENTKEYTKPVWEKLLAAINAAVETNKLKELVAL